MDLTILSIQGYIKNYISSLTNQIDENKTQITRNIVIFILFIIRTDIERRVTLPVVIRIQHFFCMCSRPFVSITLLKKSIFCKVFFVSVANLVRVCLCCKASTVCICF